MKAWNKPQIEYIDISKTLGGPNDGSIEADLDFNGQTPKDFMIEHGTPYETAKNVWETMTKGNIPFS